MKDFDTWNTKKKDIDTKIINPDVFVGEGYVWICSYGKNIGFEQSGSGNDFSRPVLIVKKFNNNMFWGIPLSTKQKEYDFYFNYIDVFGNPVSAILAQMKLMSVKRLDRLLYRINRNLLFEIKDRLKSFLL